MSYPCTCCGSCCKRIGNAVSLMSRLERAVYFPYEVDETGKCEKLIDNKCSVYDDRPLICNIDKMQALSSLSKEEFYAANIQACNAMMDEDGVPEEFRIK